MSIAADYVSWPEQEVEAMAGGCNSISAVSYTEHSIAMSLRERGAEFSATEGDGVQDDLDIQAYTK